MSEITKLYENTGIKKEVIPCPAKYYGYDCTRNNWDDEDCSCNIIGTENIDSNFEEGFASLINILWQNLTQSERKQIREILNVF